MKLLSLALLTLVAVIAVVGINHSTAQSGSSRQVDDVDRLVLSLAKRGETNTIHEVVKVLSRISTGQAAREIDTTVIILERLRFGQTNEAIRLLENRLDAALIPFASIGDTNYDAVLHKARQYRSKYPHKTGDHQMDLELERFIAGISYWFRNRDKTGIIRTWPHDRTYQAFLQSYLLLEVRAVLKKHKRFLLGSPN